jgi:hypothetical protein
MPKIIKDAKKAVAAADNKTYYKNAIYAQQLGSAAVKAKFKEKHNMTPTQYIKEYEKSK